MVCQQQMWKSCHKDVHYLNLTVTLTLVYRLGTRVAQAQRLGNGHSYY